MAYRLLLADDSITIQKVVELTLSEEDFEVTAYGDGESALEAARRLVPDIILADVFMPKLDGYALCAMVKQDPALKGVPVLLLAGAFESFDETAALRAGADDHITKPFESSELISKVNRLVEGKGAMPREEDVLTAEPVEEEIDLAEEVIEAAPVEEEDLWSVVDMQSETAPLPDATEVLTEEEIWKRANLIAEPGESTEGFGGDEGIISWDDLPAEPVLEAEEVEEACEVAEFEAVYEDELRPGEVEPFLEVSVQEEPVAEATAIMDMDELEASVFTHDSREPDIECSPVTELPGVSESPQPAAQPQAAASVSPDALREEILKAVNSVLDQKIREALSAVGKDVIERVVWDVVPDLAEEIIVKEIEKLKAGIK
jgi:CheY-like chemotaxis protein